MNKPTEAELEILQILWEHGSSTVKYINDKLNETKKVGYTTTLKIMQIMAEKGILSVNKENRQHIYSALLEKEKTQNNLLESFINKTFKGSPSKLVLQLLGSYNATQDELDEIKDLIKKLEDNG